MIILITTILVALWPLIAQYLGGMIIDILDFLTNAIHAVCMFLVEALTNLFIVNTSMLTGEDKITSLLINGFEGKFTKVGIGLLLLIATWHIFKGFFSFLGLGTEEEEAWKIGIKCMLYGVLVYESKEVCRIMLYFFETLVNGLNITSFNTSWGSLDTYTKNFANFLNTSLIHKDFWEGLTSVYLDSVEQTVSVVVKLIMFGFIIATDIKLLAVSIDLGEKYIRAAFFIIISPLTIACGVTKSTNQIFSAWIKAFTGLLISIVIKYFLLTIFSGYLQGIMSVGGSDTIKSAIVIIALVSLIEQSDELTRQLGFQAGKIMGAPSEAIGRMLRR